MNKLIVVVNTKGGPGKTVTAFMVVPYLLDGNVVVFGIDNSNISDFEVSSFAYENFNLKGKTEAIYQTSGNLDDDVDIFNIIDCGGGDDAEAALSAIAKNDLTSLYSITYIIPTNSDREQVHNVKETISLIKKYDQDPTIKLLFNRAFHDDKEALEAQFGSFFGNPRYGLEGKYKEIKKDIAGYYFIKDSPLYGHLKSDFKITLYDSFLQAKELIDNQKAIREQWAQDINEGKRTVEERKEKLYRKIDFAKDVLDLCHQLDKNLEGLLD